VHVEDEVAGFAREEEVLAAPPRPRQAASLQDRERRVERLQRGDVRGPGALDRDGRDGLVQRASRRLDLGILGNSSSSWTRSM
jgi:hypothetical protein